MNDVLSTQNHMRDPRQDETKGAVSVEYMDRLFNMSEIFGNIENIDGSVVICGLKNPESFAIPAYLAGRESEIYKMDPRTIVAFGSKAGWMQPSEIDTASPRNPLPGENPLKKDDVLRYLEDAGIIRNFPNLEIIIQDGDLSDTVPKYSGDIAFLYLDTNLEKETRICLEGLYPNLVDDGALVLNNYREFPSTLEHAKHPAYAKNRHLYIVDGADVEKWPGFSQVVDNVLGERSEELRHIKGTTLDYLTK